MRLLGWEQGQREGLPFWCKGQAEPTLERCWRRGRTWLVEGRYDARAS
ncbi:hypothetical protein E1A91_A12G190500v1 [Gossypium mustelinum]|uniref:Uncharacterized protein n=1 Tax=Gossypium mustelinum TaxID=34275 RepID=A0A5D2WW85_GOSMU|nr:hypothetical protein E1A91_A12G190500v1 [Gossypium mustelinum]